MKSNEPIASTRPGTTGAPAIGQRLSVLPVIAVLSLGLGCSSPDRGVPSVASGPASTAAGTPNVGSGGTGSTQAAPSASTPLPSPPVRPRCVAPEGINNSPQSIAEMMTLIRALPLPLTAPCIVEVLARPLKVVAADSGLSRQSAGGPESPRLFLFFGPLIVSVVPDGTGGEFLEMGELFSDTESVKAELQFPLEQLELDQEFTSVRQEDGSVCGLCHGPETQAQGFPEAAFVSRAFQPVASRLVSLEALKGFAANCDVNETPGRCAMYSALFDGGELEPAVFPEQFETLY